MAATSGQHGIDAAALAQLACPACHGELRGELGHEPIRLLCLRCGRMYPVVDGIPALIAAS